MQIKRQQDQNVISEPFVSSPSNGKGSDYELENDMTNAVETVQTSVTVSGEEVYMSKLENGIRVITESMPGVRSIAIGILVEASPHDEPREQNGLAHLTEHLLFQGTSNRDATKIARLMDVGGGNMGAFTTRDYTCFYATVLDDYRTYAIDLLSDLLLNSIFPAENLENEKEAILREIEATSDSPPKRAHTILKSFIWQDHPLGNPITGTAETVQKITREDVIYFVHENYMPDRVIIAAAGNLDHQDFVAQVRDAFWRMMGRSQRKQIPSPKINSGVVIEFMPVSQAYFSIGIPTLPYAHEDRYALHVINNILGGGYSSRLFQRLREKHGLVYNIGSEYHAYRDSGILVVEGCTSPELLNNVLELTLTELCKLFTFDEPVSQEELWRATMQIHGQHLIAAENTNTCMSRLATQELYFGRNIPTEDIIDHIGSVNDRVLQKLARQSLRAALRQAAVAVCGPKDLQHYSHSSVEELLTGHKKGSHFFSF